MAAGDNRGDDANRLLNGWKQIASHFGKDESTVKRWAAGKALPVHRVPGHRRAAVFAYRDELNLWLRGHHEVVADITAETPAMPEAEPAPSRSRIWLAASLAALIGAGGAWYAWHAGAGIPSAHRPVGLAESRYLDGVYHLEARNAEGMRRAIGLFTEAVAEDPQYAKAYVGLADAYNLVSQYTPLPADESYPKAKAAAERAIALDPGNGGAYAALAFNVFYWQRDAARSVKLFEKAVALEPNNARAHHWYALVAMHDRKFNLALREIQAAQRLQPQSPAILANKGLILFHAGRVQEALSVLQPLSQTEVGLLSPHAYLATIYLSEERYQDFLREYRRAAMLSANPTELALIDVADRAYAAGGGRAMLAAMLEEQKRQFADGKEPAFKLALTAAMLGEKTSALDYLDIAAKRREQDILGIGLEPALKPLRGDGRYRVLVARAGFSTP